MEMVSIVIPARNEEKHISECIKSILAQDFPSDKIEIIVVDGMSTDKTVEVVNRYVNNYKNIKLVLNPKSITPVALNLGIINSIGEIVIILGAHSYIDENFVKNNVRNLEKDEVSCSGGVVRYLEEDYVTRCISLATSCPFGIGNALYRYTTKEQYVDTVPFAAYKKSIFNKIGFFDEELVRNQDDELNYRVVKSGGKILLSPDIIFYYYSRSSLRKLWSQYRQYGYWKVRVIQKHKRPASLRHLVPMIFVLSLSITLLLGFFHPLFRYSFFVISIIYLIGDLFFSTALATKNSFLDIFCLPIIFPILHIGYGAGFIQGIVRFILVKRRFV